MQSMDRTTAAELTAHLERLITTERIARVREVLENRTRYVCLVLEDIYKSQNASATLRTCDALGIQDVHIIENHSPFSLDSKVSLGSCQWTTLKRYRESGAHNTQACYAALRAQGYRIIATAPGAGSLRLENIAPESKCAFVFGNEEQGLSAGAIDGADACVSLPMYGFTQSYNISVSVGIVLMHMIGCLRTSGVEWQLTDEEKDALTLEWYRTMVRSDDIIEKQFLMSMNCSGTDV
jgi:tRNA (guanosine-2'-O-)-methyltransferase